MTGGPLSTSVSRLRGFLTKKSKTLVPKKVRHPSSLSHSNCTKIAHTWRLGENRCNLSRQSFASHRNCSCQSGRQLRSLVRWANSWKNALECRCSMSHSSEFVLPDSTNCGRMYLLLGALDFLSQRSFLTECVQCSILKVKPGDRLVIAHCSTSCRYIYIFL